MYTELPDYSPTMHLKGFTAMQIYSSFKQTQRKKQKEKKRKQREQSLLEKEIFNLIESLADAAISQAMEDIFEDWK